MNDYVSALTDAAFQRADQYQGKSIFMSMSLMDSFDPDKTIHRQMLAFSERVAAKLGGRVRYRYDLRVASARALSESVRWSTIRVRHQP